MEKFETENYIGIHKALEQLLDKMEESNEPEGTASFSLGDDAIIKLTLEIN